MTSKSRSHMATTTCSIFRSALDLSTGQTDLPAAHIADIPCTAVMARGTGLMTAGRVEGGLPPENIQHEIYLFGEYKIVKGDVCIVAGDENRYSVWDSHIWKVSDPFMMLVLSDVQAEKPQDAEFIR